MKLLSTGFLELDCRQFNQRLLLCSTSSSFLHSRMEAVGLCLSLSVSKESGGAVEAPESPKLSSIISNRKTSRTVAAFEREEKAQLDPRRQTAPPQQTAACLTQPKSSCDISENRHGCACMCHRVYAYG